MKLKLSILCLVAILTNSALGDALRFIGISDQHYGGTPWGWGDATTISNLVYYAQTNFLPSFFVCTGDVSETTISSPTTCTSSHYSTYLADMAVLSKPYYSVPGNHDLPLWSPNDGVTVCWTNAGLPIHCSWTNGNYVFIGFGSYWNNSFGTIRSSDLDYMEGILTNAYPAYTNFVVMSHFPVIPDATFGQIDAGHGLERLTNLFNYYSVALYIHGHTHECGENTGIIPNTPTRELSIGTLASSFTLFALTNSTLTTKCYNSQTRAQTGGTLTFTVPTYSTTQRVVPDYYATIQDGINAAQPGDTVLVSPGTYNETPQTVRNGTVGSPIVINGQNVATTKQFVLQHSYIDLLNWTVTGLNIDYAALLRMNLGAHYCVVSNNFFNIDDHVMYGWFWQSPATRPFGTGDAASHNLLVSNTIKGCRGFIMALVYGDYNEIRNNFLADSPQSDCFNIFGRSNIIAGNVCSNFIKAAYPNHSDFIQTFGDNGFGSQNILVESNLVICVPWGSETEMALNQLSACLIPEISDWTFRNNLFINIGDQGSCSVPNTRYYNNTFIRCGWYQGGTVVNIASRDFTSGETYYGTSGTDYPNGSEVLNNVFYTCGDDEAITGWYVITTNLTNVVADYNFVCRTNYLPVTVNALHQSVGDPSGWDKYSWWETHGINGGNPQFVNVGADNFHLLGTSPLIGTATNLNSLFTADKDGVTRGAHWNIGAYQFVNTVARVKTGHAGGIKGK